MRNIIIGLLAAVSLAVLSISSAYAAPGSAHSHDPVAVAKSVVVKNAIAMVKTITKEGKLDASWGDVNASEARKQKTKSGQEWVVVFNNPKITDQDKKTLYVFLGMDGRYIAANFSGS